MLRDRSVDLRTTSPAELGVVRLERPVPEPDIQYGRLIENSQDVIFRVCIPEAKFEYINAAAKRVFGYPLEQFRAGGSDFLLSLLADDEERADMQEVIAGRKFHAVRLRRWIRADGREIWTEVRNYPVYDESGGVVGVGGGFGGVAGRGEGARGGRGGTES